MQRYCQGLKLAEDLHVDSIACNVTAKDSKLAGDLYDNSIGLIEVMCKVAAKN